MASFSFNSNISSLKAQRRLGEGSAALQKSFERLSSGLRINRASDDAAGLAISSSLGAYSRIFTQGVRNANDGVSLLNVAEGAATELNGILTRLSELAQSAANGTLSLTQRRSLDKEAHELQKEFNRVTQTTRFNNRALFDGSFGRLNIQGGTGTSGTIGFNLGSGLATNVSTGSFESTLFSYGTVSFPAHFDTGDYNRDGNVDIAASYSDFGSMILLGNGDGTFKNGQIMGQLSASNIVTKDLNGDGILDLVNSSSVYLGKGDGTFSFAQSLGGTDWNFQLGDVNGDGAADYVGTDGANLRVLLGNSNGTFGTQSFVEAVSDSTGIALADYNGDGNLDIATADGGNVRLFDGAGNGSFKAGSKLTSISSSLRSADFNHDGFADIYTDSGAFYLSNGNGTFTSTASVEGFYDAKAADLDGDGIVDLLLNNGINIVTRFGNGDGTFKASISQSLGGPVGQSAFGDFNGDGVMDISTGNQFGPGLWTNLGVATSITSIARLNLLSAGNARDALTQITAMSQRVSSELSAIGVAQSRLQAMSSVLEQSALNFTAARSRIVDADIAQESASLVARQIHQQAASAVLAQANQLPALALSLLEI